MFAAAEEDGRDDEVQLVEQAGGEVLADRRGTAADAHVLLSRGLLRLLERRLDPVRDEVERRAALHRERLARVMRQDEHGDVVRRLLAPPPLPTVVRPRSANGTEHVAAEDPGADVVERLRRELVIRARFAAVPIAVHRIPGARAEEPLEHFRTADTEGMLEILIRPGAVPVE